MFEEEALRNAAAVDEQLARLERDSAELRQLAERKPLLGVPFSLKSSWEMKGERAGCHEHSKENKSYSVY